MHLIANGTVAVPFQATDLDGNVCDLQVQLAQGPVVLVFAHPEIHASRLVVGYLRRLAEIAPTPVWVMVEGPSDKIRSYARPSDDYRYLEMPVIIDERRVAALYGVTHLPTTYLIGQDGSVLEGYSGFNRAFLNALAWRVAELSGAKPKELIADSDNKGLYELAELMPT